MATRAPFRGFALNAVDAKGRVSLPSEFRKVIDRRARAVLTSGEPVEEDKTLFLRKHPYADCLQAFDETFERELSDMLDRSDDRGGASMKGVFDSGRSGFSGVIPVKYDDNGRMVLSVIPRRMAGIGEFAFFVGAEHVFEIWDPARLKAALGDSDPDLVEILALLLEEKGASA